MSQSTTKFARTATVESKLHELRLAAEAGDSSRVVTAAGELRSLLNLFKRVKSPFKNVGDAQSVVNPTGAPVPIPGYNGPVSRALQDALHKKLQSDTLEGGKDSWKGVQRNMVQNFIPNDASAPTSLRNQDTLKALIESGNIGGKGKIGNVLQNILGDNKLKAILNKELDADIITTQGKNPRKVTMHQLLTDPGLAVQIRKKPELDAYIDRVAAEFASQYKGVAVFNYIKGLALKTMLIVVGAKMAASAAIPVAAAASMGAPAASALQQAADINAGGSTPVSSASTSGVPGHPSMTNGSNFGNLGGAQGGYGGGNASNTPFSQRIIDYSSMYRENASQDARVTLAQQQEQIEIPQEIQDHLNQVPDPQVFVEQIAAILRANGGPESAKALKEVAAYVGKVESLTAPLTKNTQ